MVGVAAGDGGFLVGDDEGAADLVGVVAFGVMPEVGVEEEDGSGFDRALGRALGFHIFWANGLGALAAILAVFLDPSFV